MSTLGQKWTSKHDPPRMRVIDQNEVAVPPGWVPPWD